jgi:small subunit ribosomal protein S20
MASKHPSTRKRLRQTLKITARNKPVRTATRRAVRSVREAIATGDKTAAVAALKIAVQRVDKSVGKGLWHRRTGSRTISRLSAQVAALK